MTDDTINTTAPELQALETDGGAIRHDTEVAVHHGLAHLEAEFVTYAKEAWAVTEEKAKEVLAWVAAKI